MIANNRKQLDNMLLKELKKAMNYASKEMLANMYDETGGYYTGGTPTMYQRTGALGDTPKVTEVTASGSEVSFDAYLDTSGKYTTGSNPSMLQVLKLANAGERFTTKGGKSARPTIGKKGFWERAESKIGKTLNKSVKKFLK